MAPQVSIGTSGWHYMHWRGPFYPLDLKPGMMFTYYSKYFSTVEINNSFYRLPEAHTFEAWHQASSPDFVFTLKGSRYITHMKKLKPNKDALGMLIDRARHLGDKLEVILFQLPPRWKVNPDRLAVFLEMLSPGYRYAFEFRDASWHDDRIYKLLGDHNVAFCMYDIAGTQSPRMTTADFVYARLHGPTNAAYKGQYSDKALSWWAQAIATWKDEGKSVYCYFDNDENAFAAQDALRLKNMLRELKFTGQKIKRRGLSLH